MQFDDLRNVCPIHFHRLFLISSSAGSWFVLSHKRLLLMVSGQLMLSILRRQLFINTCTFLMVVVVVPQVSAPYSRTVLTFVLKILTVILVEICFEFHMFFNCRNEPLALPILAFTFAPEPPCSSMILPRFVKLSTSSRASPPSVIGLMFSMLCLGISLFPLCILRPTNVKAAATLVVFFSIVSEYGIGGSCYLVFPLDPIRPGTCC
ncbi:unnamed protein product [Schistosoma guineensis]|nr:unnamed protein product [Schistosoma guineensis]